MTQAKPREELKLRRKRSFQSQTAVAKSVGISQAMYSLLELGYYDPQPEVAERLTDMFDLPASYFTDTSSNTDQAKEG